MLNSSRVPVQAENAPKSKSGDVLGSEAARLSLNPLGVDDGLHKVYKSFQCSRVQSRERLEASDSLFLEVLDRGGCAKSQKPREEYWV